MPNPHASSSQTPPSLFIDGVWRHGAGEPFVAHNPVTGDPTWRGRAAAASDIADAMLSARRAFDTWSATPLEQRASYLRKFTEKITADKADLARLICLETGKPHWESLAEVGAIIGKTSLSELAYNQRCATEEIDLNGARAATRYRPHGIVAVLGPFNLPGHLPNGHIVPALLAGNTVVFKPSELTPTIAHAMVAAWESIGLPRGVINLVQGGRDTGAALIHHPDLDAICFTGSTAGGLWIRQTLAARPRVLTALEMGGNNPLIVHDVANPDAAALATIQSAYITAGQRCSCARRLIVPLDNQGDHFIARLIHAIARIRVGAPDTMPEPFIGPLITPAAAERLLIAQQNLRQRGAMPLVEMSRLPLGDGFLSPGLIDVTPITNRDDTEHFGPLLQLIRVPDFDAAITEANRTAFGLAAGLFSDHRDHYDLFLHRVRAGVIHWNRQLTNASSRLPFGGLGLSGNHRPSGFAAVDYCSSAFATIELPTLPAPDASIPGITP